MYKLAFIPSQLQHYILPLSIS